MGIDKLQEKHLYWLHSKGNCCNVLVEQCWNVCQYFLWQILQSLLHQQNNAKQMQSESSKET